MIRKLDATVLFVKDLATCTAFYRDTLGFQTTMSDDVSVAFRLEGQDFLLLEVAAAVEMTSEEAVLPHQEGGHRLLLCAGVENVDTMYQELTAKGVTFIKPPIDQPWGRRTTYFADPEGNLWELFHHLP